jgi:hypothetical protein
MKPSLPHLDVPKHLMGPHSCARCVHSFTNKYDVLACAKDRGIRCTWVRSEGYPCGPDAKLWKQGAV